MPAKSDEAQEGATMQLSVGKAMMARCCAAKVSAFSVRVLCSPGSQIRVTQRREI
jgi:hypothetical protein